MKVLICGSRDWYDANIILSELTALNIGESDTIIHGDCRGADRIGAEVAASLGADVVAYPADWKTHGRAAGPIRNRLMITEGKPDIVLAFHWNIDMSKGTKNMVGLARRAGVEVKVVEPHIGVAVG